MSDWPELLPWEPTRATLHRWTQVVGKVRLALTPWTNHSWHVPLYVTPRGLTTGPVPHGARLFQIDLDLSDHSVAISTDTEVQRLALRPQSVAAFTRELLGALDGLGVGVEIHGAPNEVEDAVPFLEDRDHASYDRAAVERFAASLRQAHRVLTAFRAPFVGKVSPVHFFWGSFDLAVTRFSGRAAPPLESSLPNLPGWINREAYTHEVSSVGLWLGDADHAPFFYSYAYPQPDGFAGAEVQPDAAHYDPDFGEFVLPYAAIAAASDPDGTLLAFCTSTYAAARRGVPAWDGLEAEAPEPARPRQLRPR